MDILEITSQNIAQATSVKQELVRLIIITVTGIDLFLKAISILILLTTTTPRITNTGWMYTIIFIPIFGGFSFLAFRTQTIAFKRRVKNKMHQNQSKLLSPENYQEYFSDFGKLDKTEYFDNTTYIPAVIKAINEAKEYVVIVQFIFRYQEASGVAVLNAITSALERGCKVFLVLDEVGSKLFFSKFLGLPKYLRELVDNYPHFEIKIFKNSFFRTNFIMHSKVLLADNHYAIVGSHNIWDRANSVKPNDRIAITKHTNYSVGFNGEVVRYVYRYLNNFLLDGALSNFKQKESWSNSTLNNSADLTYTDTAEIIYNHFDHPNDIIMNSFLFHIAKAQHSIKIVNPYVIAPEIFLTCLELAVLSGVEIELISSEISHADTHLMKTVTPLFFNYFLKLGVKVTVVPYFIHSKFIIVDEKWLSIGSTNIDFRGLLNDHQMNLETRNPKAVSELLEIYRQIKASGYALEKNHLSKTKLAFANLYFAFFGNLL